MTGRSFGSRRTTSNPFAPRLLGTHGAIACEHYLAAQAGRDLMRAGGNAIDAAVGAALVEGVVNPHMHTIGGECAMLVCASDSQRVVCLNGNTAAPAEATPEAFRARGFAAMPDEGILAAGVPAAFDALLTALAHFGRLSFAEVVSPASTLAREGAPVHRGLLHQPRYGLVDLEEKFRTRWPGSAGVYLPDGRAPREGHVLANPALADLYETLSHLGRRAGGDRASELRAIRDGFYHGDVAAEIDRYSRAHDGLLRRGDLEAFETLLERPVGYDFRGVTVYKCGPWNQGPAMLQTLAILDHFDLQAMGHNSVEYLHTVIEALNLAFADREQYYGDPHQVDVPIEQLLRRDYAGARAALIDRNRANPELRPGDPVSGDALLASERRLGGATWGPGTVQIDAIDGDGNFAAVTPSGAWLRSAEVIPALGFPLGNRLQTFYLDPPHHPNLVAPGKRPRTTISPSLAFRDGVPWMCFGSMGGDQQDQWQLQFLLNCTVFEMPLPSAIEAPKLSSEHFPGFFAPHDRFPRRVRIEPRIPRRVREALAERGHDVEVAPDWTEGYLLAAARDPDTRLLEAAADPRGGKSDVFPAFALCW